ncbi:GSCOCG00010597001-RA-CDS [Cotesia congregata]|uniref:Similar to sconC: E3 ubiquitin ligase complex SCF subunit sconC (Talaromyces stipitatus (Strain ATCC 10500 / CBS 375.48 / QM 6759 / NRRL 1006)) n=1 Tax=Cotesia congregata TaxID=51543 RepID=A0A8J2MUR3_COTCN|nr:GSCOCG00010597001-RA-CDS [Cotesia congregata]CAG5100835.1 Similar to sconC: E3 ubiquitin ligase complex SCF subunit sconC (Talaromyces stipitatus (strain ATCC 10500 / CBS 375.48 / QM 6759 / NRRL 1006)) [Cotesia congregata]
MNRGSGDFVTIRCSDGNIRARRSALQPYRALYEARSSFSGGLNEIRLPHFPTSVASQIVSWAERHMNDPGRSSFEPTQQVDVTLTPEDSNQLSSLDINTLLRVIQASDEYIVLDLLSGACKTVAEIFENTDPMVLRRELFGGESGFSEEEEERLRRETEWMEEL